MYVNRFSFLLFLKILAFQATLKFEFKLKFRYVCMYVCKYKSGEKPGDHSNVGIARSHRALTLHRASLASLRITTLVDFFCHEDHE